MGFEKFLFYVFALILIFAAVRVITVRNPVHAALFLVLAFFTSAALWLLIEAEFLAIALVLVYVGAVMVLFLFVVMMLDINVDPVREGFIKYLPVGAAVALLIVIEMGLVVSSSYFSGDQYSLTAHAADYSNTKELGSVLYTFYVYPFEIASVILLVAIVAAISLTMRRREGEGVKTQNPGEQVRVSRDDRVRLVRLASEKKN
ncbi:MAG TPA: NADH-quinone oxidoreductase subunit J [Candidatus Competibacteraceae bacterium]|nr:NADH-quinone oxidoreductase subunit J [Candidatus Competibacteraceae bacterium]HRZ06484.1 NADH-quinone oxidoreductase subunit J [Candidatus Competibacteraceae bacterium]HSA45915.1 NADH-quinone oxidoreductase subunit J [Candidatus Competibacteraceae bacterium]